MRIRYWSSDVCSSDLEDTGRKTLAVAVESSFESYFAGKPAPLAEAAAESAEGDDAGEGAGEGAEEEAGEEAGEPVITNVIERSPDSARIVLLASGSFLSDDVLDLLSGAGDRKSTRLNSSH